MPNEFEKDFDDQVYEDEFYEDNFADEELIDEDLMDDELMDEEDGYEETEVSVIFACEDCDYRWEDVIIKKKGEDIEDMDIVCPMCGSTNVTQL